MAKIGDKLQSLPKYWLFAILFLVTSIPLFHPLSVPTPPDDGSADLYAHLMQVPAGSTILLASDWTNSTRGDSKGQFVAIIKILADRKLKAAIYSTADAQAPRVARDTIAEINAVRVKNGQPPYSQWNDWVSLGFYPSAEGQLSSIATDLRKAFASKTEQNPATGEQQDVFESPVLQKIYKLSDCALSFTITASKTSDLTVERLLHKTPLVLMVTGVMGPQTQNYYYSGQIVGLAIGVKGAYDLETLMAKGLNVPGGIVSTKIPASAPPLSNQTDVQSIGTLFYPPLQFALWLLIIMVVIGNVGMALSKMGAQSK